MDTRLVLVFVLISSCLSAAFAGQIKHVSTMSKVIPFNVWSLLSLPLLSCSYLDSIPFISSAIARGVPT